jgi:hypothetical protein
MIRSSMVEVGGSGKMCRAGELLTRFSVVAQIIPPLSYGHLSGRSTADWAVCGSKVMSWLLGKSSRTLP